MSIRIQRYIGGSTAYTFAANSSIGVFPIEDSEILSGDRIDCLWLNVKVKLTSGTETTIQVDDDDELLDLISAVLGSVNFATPRYQAGAVNNVDAEVLHTVAPAMGVQTRLNIGNLGEALTVGTAGAFTLRMSIPIAFVARNTQVGGQFAMWGGFISDAQLQIRSGDGSASLGGATWAVDTTASAFEFSISADATKGLSQTHGSTVQYWQQSATSNRVNQTPDGVHLALAEVSTTPDSLGVANNISNGIEVVDGDETLLMFTEYQPVQSAEVFYRGLPPALAANLGRRFQGSHSATDSSGLSLRKFNPIFALGMTDDPSQAPVGVLRVTFGSGWTPTSAIIAGIRVPTASSGVKRGGGECACHQSGSPVSAPSNPKLRPYVHRKAAKLV